MDLATILLWLLAFSVIVLFLGALTYFLGRPSPTVVISEKKSPTDTINQQQQQSNRSSNRRKHARNAANRKQRQEAAINENSNKNNVNEDKQEIKSIIPEIKIEQEEEEESSVQPTDEEQEQKDEFEDPMTIEEILIPSPLTSIQVEQQQPTLPIKQRNKNKNNYSKVPISSNEESILPSKPQASIIPVKQTLPAITITNIESTQVPQDNNAKLNGTLSSSHNTYSYAGYNSVPPRFRHQQQNGATNGQRIDKRKTTTQIKKSSPKQNDFIPSPSKPKINNNNNNQLHVPQHELSNHSGYSSESDILSESPSTANTTDNHSPLLSTSTDSQHSLKDELVSIFDNVSFSSDELELILNKISSKQLSNKYDWQNLLSTTKNEKTLGRILDETYCSEVKILAIELQAEKHRVLELTRSNAEMDSTIRQLQQPNNNMIPYQQTILSYQMQIRRLTDENARLVHQLHACSMMPASINELKQQQQILDEQLRQIMMRNSTLESEVADGERASKHAAEIYKKSDTQKQERIEQMLADINKYKKIDKDLSTLQQKHTELDKTLHSKLNDITHQRDDLQKTCQQLKEQILQFEQNQTSNSAELEQELNEVKAKNNVLRQRNWKIMEQLNKLSHQQEQVQ